MNKSKNEKKLIKAEKLRLKELDKKQIAEQKARGDHIYTPVFAKLIRKLVRDNKAKKNVIKSKVKKVIKGLKKASKSHAAQAKTLQTIFRKGKTKR